MIVLKGSERLLLIKMKALLLLFTINLLIGLINSANVTANNQLRSFNDDSSLFRRFNFTRRRSKFPILPPKLRELTTPEVITVSNFNKRVGILDDDLSNVSVMVKSLPSSNNSSKTDFSDFFNISASRRRSTVLWPRLATSRYRGFASVYKLTKNSPSSNFLVTWQKKPLTKEDPINQTTTVQPILENSLIIQSPSVVWPLSRRSISRRIWTTHRPLITTSVTPLPKLLMPKPTRPAIYSLDGFIPTPSMIHLTTTSPPDYNLMMSSSRRKEIKKPPANEGFQKKTRRFSIVMRRKGIPGRDYPAYNHVPATRFRCGWESGMFADPKTGCQVWHMCPGGGKPHRYSFLCPQGTIFSQKRGICDWWYNVSCDAKNSNS
ncbi:uncharacterized protein LOC111621176 isoform X2 [Centruroides sculpturatus]|uniref:uncharacterized protein LOC111621176 isoform X2 n=1 Tax=Centruroides sculpturatus TaxID=218467 RepID=UPI000C6CA1D9|nr:uncharacterized protein LOC111621176 isoform X2 [Centruroides sculpturatus]